MLEIIISFGLVALVVYFFKLADQILPPSTEVLLYAPDDDTSDDADSKLDQQDNDEDNIDTSDINLDDFKDLLDDKYDEGLDVSEEDARDMLNKIYDGGGSRTNG